MYEDVVNDMMQCSGCFENGALKPIEISKNKKRIIEYYIKNVPGLEYVVNKEVSYIFSNGLTTGNLDGDEKLNDFCYRVNAQGIVNKLVLKSAIKTAMIWGECGIRFSGNNLYLVEPYTYQTIITYIDGILMPFGYIVSTKGKDISGIDFDLTNYDERGVLDFLKSIEESDEYIFITATSGDFLNLRNDVKFIHGDSPLLKDQYRLDLLINTYKRLNFDVTLDSPARIVLWTKQGWVEGDETTDISTSEVLNASVMSSKNRQTKAEEKKKQLCKEIQESKPGSVVLLSGEFEKNIEKLDRVTKATEFFDWLSKDVNTVCQMFGFDATLCGVSEFSGQVSMAAVIDDAMLSNVVPLRENYALQFSSFIANKIGVDKVYFNKYDLQQTEGTLDKLAKMTGIIYKLQVGAKNDERVDRTLEHELSEMCRTLIRDDRGNLKDILDL